VAATLKSIDYNVAMTFILNNNNNNVQIIVLPITIVAGALYKVYMLKTIVQLNADVG